MKPIEGSLYSPFQKKLKKIVWNNRASIDFDFENEFVWERLNSSVNKVRASEGFKVNTFRELMDEVAKVTLSNKSFEMFFRGQSFDYKNNQAPYFKDRKQKSIIYPSICRPEKHEDGTLKYSIKKTQISRRYEDLSKMIELVRGARSYFDEYYYALFQHYGILNTPFVDITQSLRLAATFALRKSATGYVYVFGLPYPNQSISYFSDYGIVLLKLQNVMPVKALRPRYQEGFLVGKYPIRPTKTKGDDLSNRMVAKFFVNNSNGRFWDSYFPPMPDEILYPKNDKVEKELSEVKVKFENKH